MKKLLHCSGFLLAMFFAISADAQALFGESIHLELTPQNPAPQEIVTVRLNAYSVDVSGATIAWFEDGVRRADVDNEYEMSVFLGPLGSKTRVTAEIYRPGKTPLSVTKVITAQTVDIVIEPQTSSPSFYRGKSLPAPDEEVRVIAVPHAEIDETFTYTWRLGQDIIGGTSGRGKNVITFTMPRRETLLSVTVTDNRGTRIGGRAVQLSPNNPEVLFYEENLLRGMRQSAIGNTLSLPQDSETTIHAGVYNLANNLFETNARLYWTLDDKETFAFNGEGQSITLQNTGGSQRVEVGFFAQNINSLTQFVDDSFVLFFQ